MTKQIREYIENAYTDVLKTLEDITAIDRESRNIEGLSRMAEYLEDRLRRYGCEIERYEDPEYGPTVVGRKHGDGSITIMLYAHMDTVWPADTAARRPFTIEGDYAYGAGVSDCSHGIIGTLYSLETLNHIGFHDYKELIVLFNSDEELYSPCSEKYLRKYARLSDVAFCMEGSDKTDEYISHRAGVMFYDIEAHGVKSHAGGMPELGKNAIAELSDKVVKIHQLKIPNAYLHTTLIKGGINEGMVPDYASAHVDVRVDTMDAYDAVKKEMARIENDTFIDGTKCVFTLRQGGCLPLMRIPEQDKFCRLVEEIGEEIGHPVHEAFCGGGANAVITALEGTPTIDGITPTSGCWHTDSEYLYLPAIVPRVTLMTEVIRRICLDEKYKKA